MLKKYFLIFSFLILGNLIPGVGGITHAGTAEEALNIAFDGSNTTQAPVEPTVIATSIATRSALVEKYSAEYRTNNPNLSDDDIYAAATSRADSEIQSSTPINIIVSEKMPGSTCTCATKGYEGQDDCPSTIDVSARLYQCSVNKGMVSFQNIIREVTKWFIYITMLFGVLALVGSGILWAWGSESEEYTKKAKSWAMNIIIGLAILFTFRYILGFLAPWIFQ